MVQLLDHVPRTRETRFATCRASSFATTGPIDVHPRVLIRSVSAVEMRHATFEMDLQLGFEWQDPEFVKLMATDAWQAIAEKDGWQHHMANTSWNPGIYIQNLASSHKMEVWYSVSNQFVTLNCRLVGTFKTRYFLQDYPFNFQVLSVRFASSFDVSMVRFIRDPQRARKGPDKLILRGFILEDWMLQPLVLVRRGKSAAEDSATGLSYDELRCEVMLRHRPEFTLWHIGLVDLSLVVVALSVLAMPVEDPEDRMNWSLTILLAGVAFKLVVAEKLPATPYLTLLHKYMDCGFSVLVIVTLSTPLKAYAHSSSLGVVIDVLTALYAVAYNAYFVYASIVASGRFLRARNGYIEKSDKAAKPMLMPPDTPGNWRRATSEEESQHLVRSVDKLGDRHTASISSVNIFASLGKTVSLGYVGGSSSGDVAAEAPAEAPAVADGDAPSERPRPSRTIVRLEPPRPHSTAQSGYDRLNAEEPPSC